MPDYIIARGGDLILSQPAQGVGPLHFTRAENTLFEDGAETLLPGWEAFFETLPVKVEQIVGAKNPAGDFEILAIGEGRVFRLSGEASPLIPPFPD